MDVGALFLTSNVFTRKKRVSSLGTFFLSTPHWAAVIQRLLPLGLLCRKISALHH